MEDDPVVHPADYPLIADHGVAGDLQTCALITDAPVDSFCGPRFDSSSIFGCLLDRSRGGGLFRIAPAAEEFTREQLHIPGTAVLVTFSPCTSSFSYAGAVAEAGMLDKARLAFEKMLTCANHLGLYAEEIGLTGEQLGNFPQAFTHLALIDSAITLDTQLDVARA